MKSSNKKALKKAPKSDTQSNQTVSFPIIGIGASAGGLEALETFFKSVPTDSGIGFVVVQHLDPAREDMMSELLQRVTEMPVQQVTDRMPVKPNNVYIIPPNHDLSILNGVLHLLDPVAPRGLSLPIDSFFEALAADQRQRSIGVILSGMGSDGSRGLCAIKENGGAIFVQSKSSAKFDGMPDSAIETGLVDVVAPVEQLVKHIIAYLNHDTSLDIDSDRELQERNLSGLEKVILALRTKTGHDFSLYKKSTIYRRIERRMSLHQLTRIADYVRYLNDNPVEIDLLFKELLIGVTSFFRDPEVWQLLRDRVIPNLLSMYPDGHLLRAWTPACSTGEEAYSLAMVFQEAVEDYNNTHDSHVNYTLQIFATDLDPEAIDKARIGSYPVSIVKGISEDRLRRFFTHDHESYQINKNIREMVIFAPQNLVMDPPFTKLHLLTCRNLLIYLESDLQKKLLPLFHYSLVHGGYLVLGASETVGSSTDLFVPLPGKARVYQRNDSVLGQVQLSHIYPSKSFEPVELAARSSSALVSSNLQSLTEALLLSQCTPPAVLSDSHGDIVYISGKTGKYLEPAAGKVNNNIFAMARKGLSSSLQVGFGRVQRERTPVTLKNIIIGTNGGTQHVDVSITPIVEPAALGGMILTVFVDIDKPIEVKISNEANTSGKSSEELILLNQKLLKSHDELQTIREEMQSSQEELKSANEELQSTNEELQSTNEELTTSKEEMQSMNEELQTVNHELQAKLDELGRANDDMENLLSNTQVATLFLDSLLRVRRFTNETTKLIKLIPGDVGRPISDIVSELDYPQMVDDAREVLRSLIFQEKQVACHDGRWFKVRIMPYRTQTNLIDGVVLIFTDISYFKATESTISEALSLLKSCHQNEEKQDISLLKKAQTLLEDRLDCKPLDTTTTRNKLAIDNNNQ